MPGPKHGTSTPLDPVRHWHTCVNCQLGFPAAGNVPLCPAATAPTHAHVLTCIQHDTALHLRDQYAPLHSPAHPGARGVLRRLPQHHGARRRAAPPGAAAAAPRPPVRQAAAGQPVRRRGGGRHRGHRGGRAAGAGSGGGGRGVPHQQGGSFWATATWVSWLAWVNFNVLEQHSMGGGQPRREEG